MDRAGDPLDLHHAFAAHDDVDEMRHFLDRAGYLHIKAIFTAEEVERFVDRGGTRSFEHHAGRSVLVVVGQR